MSDVISREFPHRGELPYRAILSETNGKFYFYQPELNLIASGDTVASAYENFCGVRLNFFHEIERAGLEDELPTRRALRATGALRGGRGFRDEMGVFLFKTAIVFLLIAAFGAIGMFATGRLVRNEIARLDTGAFKSALATFSGGFGAEMRKLASAVQHASLVDFANNAARHAQAMPSERKEQLRESVGVLAQEAKPIVDAAIAPFAAADEKPASGTRPPRKP